MLFRSVSDNTVGGGRWRGITYVGSAATFGPGPVRAEVHLLDYAQAGSLRGSLLTTSLVKCLRGDRVFETPDALVQAMDEDRTEARAYWDSADRKATGS